MTKKIKLKKRTNMRTIYSTRQQRSKSIETRFWEKVDKKSDNECWEWKAYLEDGYGRFLFGGKMERTHRVSWVLHFGNLPEDKQVLHSCDNRKCVNPNHLFLGTNHDNVLDRNKKERQARGEKNNHKLTEDQIREIRNLFFIKCHTQTKIGELFKVTPQQISYIIRRESWAWLK